MNATTRLAAHDQAIAVVRRGLLVDIAHGRVADNGDGLPVLTYDDGQTVPVSAAVWSLYRAGLCTQLDGDPAWVITGAGADALGEAP